MCVIMGSFIKGLHSLSIIQLVWIISTPYLASIFVQKWCLPIISAAYTRYSTDATFDHGSRELSDPGPNCLHIICNIGF